MKYFSKHYLAVVIATVCAPTICSSVFADDLDETDNTIEEVIVTGSPFAKSAEAVNKPVNILSGDKLQNAAAATLGETLNGQLGVSSASFGYPLIPFSGTFE